MKNADKPAAPFQEVTGMIGGVPTGYKNHNGLTKREMFAMHAMNGLCSCSIDGELSPNAKLVASVAVAYADELLAELERTK